ncbi:hypothetical protein BKA81DRAFT_421290 [Phyllosticta paracitricarpa]
MSGEMSGKAGDDLEGIRAGRREWRDANQCAKHPHHGRDDAVRGAAGVAQGPPASFIQESKRGQAKPGACNGTCPELTISQQHAMFLVHRILTRYSHAHLLRYSINLRRPPSRPHLGPRAAAPPKPLKHVHTNQRGLGGEKHAKITSLGRRIDPREIFNIISIRVRAGGRQREGSSNAYEGQTDGRTRDKGGGADKGRGKRCVTTSTGVSICILPPDTGIDSNFLGFGLHHRCLRRRALAKQDFRGGGKFKCLPHLRRNEISDPTVKYKPRHPLAFKRPPSSNGAPAGNVWR